MGWFHTLRQYWKNPKGRHDIKDYAKALAIIAMSALAGIVLLYLIFS
jgi:hypothetical protein